MPAPRGLGQRPSAKHPTGLAPGPQDWFRGSDSTGPPLARRKDLPPPSALRKRTLQAWLQHPTHREGGWDQRLFLRERHSACAWKQPPFPGPGAPAPTGGFQVACSVSWSPNKPRGRGWAWQWQPKAYFESLVSSSACLPPVSFPHLTLDPDPPPPKFHKVIRQGSLQGMSRGMSRLGWVRGARGQVEGVCGGEEAVLAEPGPSQPTSAHPPCAPPSQPSTCCSGALQRGGEQRQAQAGAQVAPVPGSPRDPTTLGHRQVDALCSTRCPLPMPKNQARVPGWHKSAMGEPGAVMATLGGRPSLQHPRSRSTGHRAPPRRKGVSPGGHRHLPELTQATARHLPSLGQGREAAAPPLVATRSPPCPRNCPQPPQPGEGHPSCPPSCAVPTGGPLPQLPGQPQPPLPPPPVGSRVSCQAAKGVAVPQEVWRNVPTCPRGKVHEGEASGGSPPPRTLQH